MIVANRLPVDRVKNDDGSTTWRKSPGGLVTAIEPVMRANDGTWIGWPGGTDQDLEPFEDDGMNLVPLSMTAEEIEKAMKQQDESYGSRASALMGAFTGEEDWLNDVAYTDRLSKLTRQDIIAFANKYFGENYVAIFKRKFCI